MSFTEVLYRLGKGAARHRWVVVAAWIVAAVGLLGVVMTSRPIYVDDMKIAGSDSARSIELMESRFPGGAGTSANVVFRAPSGTLSDPDAVRAIAAALDWIKGLPDVSAVGDLTTTGMVSPDGDVGVARVRYAKTAGQLGSWAVADLDEAADVAREAGLQVELSGPLVETTSHPKPGESEGLGLLAAVFILLFVFGSVAAMLVPLTVALVGVMIGAALVAVVTFVAPVPTAAPILAMMIGLGVGIDYSLLMVTRYRENLARGLEPLDAAGRATATAGAAVVFAGATVVISVLGLWVSGIRLIGMLGTMPIVTVFVAVLAAVTLTPALLGVFGRSIDRLRVRRINTSAKAEASFTTRAARAVTRRPAVYLMAGVLLLLLLASPVLDLRLGQADSGVASRDTTKRRAYDLIARGFGPGSNGPLLITVALPKAGGDEATAVVAEVVRGDRGIAAVSPAQFSPDGRTAVMMAIPTSAPSESATADTVHRLRQEVLPGATADNGARAYVGGSTATFIDLADRVSERLPWLIAAVIAISFVLLTVVFRSILVPLKAALMNPLSIGAAYGAMVAVFQWGWGRGVTGLEDNVSIVSFAPMIMFAVLFGISMDYEVFLISRIREEHLTGSSTQQSIISGTSSMVRVITAAAAIMIVVFGSFIGFDDVGIKMVGFGLAVAVLVDATLVRSVLVPASMSLLGEANWWLPKWLDKLMPRLQLEGEAALLPHTETPTRDDRLAGGGAPGGTAVSDPITPDPQ